MTLSIFGLKPGHDASVCLLQDGRLSFSYEAEKDSNFRHSAPTSDMFVDAFAATPGTPDIIAVSGWEKRFLTLDSPIGSGYLGHSAGSNQFRRERLFGQSSAIFSCSHERSHIIGAYGMSPYPQDEPCYALVWEGLVGAFYEVESPLRITKLGDVLMEPGSKFAFAYAVANPTHNAMFGLFDPAAAGKLMALAAFSQRLPPAEHEARLIKELLHSATIAKSRKADFAWSPLHDSGVDSDAFKEFAGKFSDALFQEFHDFAERKVVRGRPLIIAGGCGLNCDWNTQWRECGLFSDTFVPPCANDTGVAIGAAIDARGTQIGDWKVEWDVYCGQPFREDTEFSGNETLSVEQLDVGRVAQLLAAGRILGCVRDRCEMGPRALGNRSLLAAPFDSSMRDRLNSIKQRETFRPIAPVCLEEDATTHFDGPLPSPYMLYFQRVVNPRLRAVTHVNGTARAQTVRAAQNPFLARLLAEFRRVTGVSVLCNTSLNYKGFGFINSMSDVIRFLGQQPDVHGAIVGERLLLKRDSGEAP